MRVLVAGGAGMIGTALVRYLRGGGHEAVVADVDVDGHDLRRSEAADWAMSCRPDAVIDCACRTCGIGYSMTHHAEMFHHTSAVPISLMEAAQKAGVGKYLVVSSACVYSDDTPVPNVEEDGDKGDPETANYGYGWGKRLAEVQGRLYAQQYGMRVVIVRPANVYGPSYNWTSHPDMHVIPSLLTRMLRGDDPLVVWGSGRQTRSFLHEIDCARRMVSLLEKGNSGEAYNLGGDEVSIRELARALADLCGYRGDIQFDLGKPEGPRRKAQDISKMRRVLPGLTSVPLTEGLLMVVEAARRELGR